MTNQAEAAKAKFMEVVDAIDWESLSQDIDWSLNCTPLSLDIDLTNVIVHVIHCKASRTALKEMNFGADYGN